MIIHHSNRKSFLASGFKASEYFDHHVLELRKKYPDSVLVMHKRGFRREEIESGSFLQINIYANDVDAYPEELFLDRQLNWHNQQFGKKGLVGAAGLFFPDPITGFVTIVQSDLIQQIYRVQAFRKYKSRLENRFNAWARTTFNAILNSAGERGVEKVYIPTSRTVTSLLNKKVDPSVFERIYDAPARGLSADQCVVRGLGYWRIDLALANYRLAQYEPTGLPEPRNGRKQVCILHDIEQNVDTPISVSTCRRNLERMLDIEKRKQVTGTYNILGKIFPEIAPRIIQDGHVIGFHSWNHDVSDLQQLRKVRKIDLQVKGYRPPQSRVTDELTPYNLAYWNFEWLANSRYSLGREDCFVEREVAHVSIDIDDYGLYTNKMSYQRWHDCILERIRDRDVYAFSVHDCYADLWIENYDRLLDAIAKVAEFKTCEDIAGRLFMAAAH